MKASDLQLLFTRDTREAYEFFSRGIDRTGIDQQPWHLRALTYAKLFFVAFTMRLSPAHRAIYAVALIATIIGLIKLFAGFEFVTLLKVNQTEIGLPIPMWQDSILFLCVGFVLLNLLIVLEVADRLSLKHDLTVARDIQRAMLPQGTFRAPGIEVHGETRPANTVGGDFFDMIPLADGRVIVALGDVAGKGSPAALLMALLLAMLRTLVDEGLPPGPLLERLNVQLLRHAPRSRFVTIFFAVLEPDGRMQWVNAGQNPPRIRRADGRIERAARHRRRARPVRGHDLRDQRTDPRLRRHARRLQRRHHRSREPGRRALRRRGSRRRHRRLGRRLGARDHAGRPAGGARPRRRRPGRRRPDRPRASPRLKPAAGRRRDRRHLRRAARPCSSAHSSTNAGSAACPGTGSRI